jgi:hypothetical protein
MEQTFDGVVLKGVRHSRHDIISNIGFPYHLLTKGRRFDTESKCCYFPYFT